MMETNGWWLSKLHGNQFQPGLPDYIACHPKHGVRLIEVKTDEGQMTKAQRIIFPQLIKFGAPLYILRDHKDYPLLFGPPNVNAFMIDKDTAYTRVK